MKTISEIRADFEKTPAEDYDSLIRLYEDDTREGVRKILQRAIKNREALENEKRRLEAMTVFEKEYRSYGMVCGIDEAGRGPLAGPVAAGAVILPEDAAIPGLNDSKQLTAKKREELYDIIFRKAVAAGVGIVSPKRIDEINILQATYEAMRKAVASLKVAPDVLLNDAVMIPQLPYRQVPIIKGDQKSVSIAAASIIAKVTRDRLMTEYDRIYPEYDFAGNKGYGSAAHIEALKKYGPCPIHRKSFIGHFTDQDVSPDASLKNKRELGTGYELRAAEFLKAQGLEILEHSFRSDFGEIDLIAEDDGVLAFVEVKYRKTDREGSSLDAVDKGKQQKILKTAEYYRMMHNIGEERPFRFDVVGIDGELVRWVRNAFPL